MKLTIETLNAAIAEDALCRSGETVHVYSDGTVGHGTDHCTTTPAAPDGVVYTFDEQRADDPWDCFVEVAS